MDKKKEAVNSFVIVAVIEDTRLHVASKFM